MNKHKSLNEIYTEPVLEMINKQEKKYKSSVLFEWILILITLVLIQIAISII